MSTYGPAYSKELDESRIHRQMDRVRNLMLARSIRNQWLTLREMQTELEIAHKCEFPQASISAQLRHLRKVEFGGYIIEKRRRVIRKKESAVWEYILRARVAVPAPLQIPLYQVAL